MNRRERLLNLLYATPRVPEIDARYVVLPPARSESSTKDWIALSAVSTWGTR